MFFLIGAKKLPIKNLQKNIHLFLFSQQPNTKWLPQPLYFHDAIQFKSNFTI
jgi:hypothetical protein